MSSPVIAPEEMAILQMIFSAFFNILVIGILVWGFVKTKNSGFIVLGAYGLFNVIRMISFFFFRRFLYTTLTGIEFSRLFGIFSTVSNTILGIVLLVGLGLLIIKYPVKTT